MPAPALLLANPATWAALAEAAKWTAITIGVAGAGYGAYRMSQSNSTSRTGTATQSTTTTCQTCQNACPPCVPPVGTRWAKRIDRVPPSKPHHPCTGDHLHILIRAQNPRSCQCFWNRPSSPNDVICLPQGGGIPPGYWTP